MILETKTHRTIPLEIVASQGEIDLVLPAAAEFSVRYALSMRIREARELGRQLRAQWDSRAQGEADSSFSFDGEARSWSFFRDTEKGYWTLEADNYFWDTTTRIHLDDDELLTFILSLEGVLGVE